MAARSGKEDDATFVEQAARGISNVIDAVCDVVAPDGCATRDVIHAVWHEGASAYQAAQGNAAAADAEHARAAQQWENAGKHAEGNYGCSAGAGAESESSGSAKEGK